MKRFRHEKKKKTVIRYISASSLLALGVVGCLLPFAPGVPFILAALYFFNPQWFKKNLAWVKKKLGK